MVASQPYLCPDKITIGLSMNKIKYLTSLFDSTLFHRTLVRIRIEYLYYSCIKLLKHLV